MITSSTFIPSRRVLDIFCQLWIEYGRQGETRQLLIDLRGELGAAEFALFQKDMQRWLDRKSARTAIHRIMRAAIARGEQHPEFILLDTAAPEHAEREKQLKTIYQPA